MRSTTDLRHGAGDTCGCGAGPGHRLRGDRGIVGRDGRDLLRPFRTFHPAAARGFSGREATDRRVDRGADRGVRVGAEDLREGSLDQFDVGMLLGRGADVELQAVGALVVARAPQDLEKVGSGSISRSSGVLAGAWGARSRRSAAAARSRRRIRIVRRVHLVCRFTVVRLHAVGPRLVGGPQEWPADGAVSSTVGDPGRGCSRLAVHASGAS
ncbi:hypothetical protein GCM10010273_10110 [Streptomyces lavendulocolor]